MRISVVTPSFNQGEFLERCLSSVSRQSLQPLEHLVYDPGSTDDSRKIAAETPGVTLIAEPDHGQGDAVAKGMMRATGDIIAWLNSDDEYADDGVFAAVADAFASPEQPDIVYGRGSYVGRDGEFLRDAYVISKPDELAWRLFREVGILQPATFISKALIDRIGPVSKDYHFCMDYEFWIRAHQAGAKFHYLDKPLARARYYNANKTMGQRGESLREVIDMVKARFGFAHAEWVRRLADHQLNGNDGILKNATNQENDPDKLELHTIVLNARINGDFDTSSALLSDPKNPTKRATVDLLYKWLHHLPGDFAVPVSSETSAVPGAQTYDVGSRRWSFRRSWMDAQLARTTDVVQRLAAERTSDTCVIVGNGPSLNATNLERLERQDVFLTNYAIINPKLRRLAKYLCVTNYLVAEQGAHTFNTLDGIQKFVPYWLSYCVLPSPLTHYVRSVGVPKFGTDFRENVSWRSTVSFFAMQMAYALGYEKVLLVGFDHAYSQPKGMSEGVVIEQHTDDANHFDPRYFKGKQWQAADTDNMEAMYRLARDAFTADGREIVNCTTGGRLELFRRGELESELAAARAPSAIANRRDVVKAGADEPLRVLVIDITPAGNGTATGELKQTLFGDLKGVSTLQLCAWNRGVGRVSDGKGVAMSDEEADALVSEFAPHLILYRPVPDVPALHRFAMDQIRKRNEIPLAVWIMDDWPEALKLRDAAQAEALDRDWRQLLEWSSVRLSISEAMSKALRTRYGKEFVAIANGVDPAQWRRRRLKIRYGGGLAGNMSLASVVRLADAVEALAKEGVDATLEILTRQHWLDAAATQFQRFSRTQISTEVLSPQAYRDWLMGADVLAICYNFDGASQTYTRTSMANKLPECLASGAVVLAHGPTSLATIALARDLDCAVVVDEPSVDRLKASLKRIVNDPAWADDLVRKSRKAAFEQFAVENVQSRLLEALLRGASEKVSRPATAALDDVSRRLGAILEALD